MSGQHGTAVVLDLSNSKVVASYHLDTAARRTALPGSALKPLVLFSLLESGKVNSQTALVCHRPLIIAGHRLDCSHPVSPLPLDPAAALAYSCNSYFTSVALRFTPIELRNALLAQGFTYASGYAPNEAAGTIGLAAMQSQLQLQAIGEWGIRVTPLEMLRAYAGIARLADSHGTEVDPLFTGLAGSVSYGMGHAAQPDVAIRVAGKTGTSNADEGPWTHAWFAGYAPANHPEIAIIVFLERGRGPDAAAIAKQVFTDLADSHASGAVKGTAR